MTPSQLESLVLLAPPEPAQPSSIVDFRPRRAYASQTRERHRPDYQRCLLDAPPNQEGTGPSRSHADFYFCKKAAQRGWSAEETSQMLLEVSEKAQQCVRDGDRGYPLVTAKNAADAAARGRQRGRA